MMDDVLVRLTCAECAEPFGLARATEQLFRRTRQEFKCPHGHGNVFRKGDSEADVLRRERDRLKQQIAERDDRLKAAWERVEREAERTTAAERRANGYKGHAAKLAKRAAAGVCPCCNRQFVDMHRHMTSKHPTFSTTPPEGVSLQ